MMTGTDRDQVTKQGDAVSARDEHLSAGARRLEFATRICACATAFLAALGLVAYLPGLRLLGSFGADNIPMAPSTTICFLLLSVGVLGSGPTGGAR